MVYKKCCGGEWHWKTCCCLGLENFLFPSAPVWGWSEDPGKEGSRTLLFILTMGFLFGKNTTKASFQRPEWILEARKKARGKKNSAPGSDSVHLPCLNSWPEKREQPQGEVQWLQSAPQHCLILGILVCSSYPHLSPKPGDSGQLSGFLSRAQVRGPQENGNLPRFPGKCALMVVCTA